MNYALILSGGTGTRLGASIPKQYLMVGNRPIIAFAIETFSNHPQIDTIIVVAADEWREFIERELERVTDKPVFFAHPGETRQLSILNGLNAIMNVGSEDWVIIHDAARPLVTEKIINDCLSVCNEGFDGAMPVIPVKDTIYQSTNKESITGLLDRSTLYAGQAPEAFAMAKYIQAHKDMPFDQLVKINGSSELAYKMGLKIKLVEGDPNNYKITDTSDLERFKNSKR